MKILAADYVLPIGSELISKGGVVYDRDVIVAVGECLPLRRQFPDAVFEDLGEAAILPGFVNCHSHLEITAMRGLLDSVEHDFASWLVKLSAARSGMTNEEIEIAAVAGAIEGARAGVTCFGDIGRYGRAGFEALKKVGLRGVVFQETEFSPDNKTADDDLEKLKEKFFDLRESETALVRVGISPHAPYTVSRRLFEQIAEFAAGERVPLTIHAAESVEEDELMRFGKGFFVDVFKKFQVNWKSPHLSPIEFLESTGILAAKPLLAHCVTATESELEIILHSGSTVAHCPKSNAKFGHGYAPFEKMLDSGISVGLGSDSVSSNNTCDILEESRFAALSARNRRDRKRFITANEMLETATLGGAKALGLDKQIGSLEAGKQADIAVVSLANIALQPINDIHASLVFSANARDVFLTIVAGQEVYRDGQIANVDEDKTTGPPAIS